MQIHVIAGLDPAIHVNKLALLLPVDPRVKSGDDRIKNKSPGDDRKMKPQE